MRVLVVTAQVYFEKTRPDLIAGTITFKLIIGISKVSIQEADRKRWIMSL